MSFAIVVDSVADLSEEECARFGITSVPLSVEVGGETFKDQAEISSEEFYDKMIASDTLPKSSQPSPSEFMDIYNALASEGADEIIAIHIAAVLSGTSESSNLAANQVEVPVEVIDSFNACSGQGLLALLACEMRDAGASAQECAQAIKDARAHTRFFIACGTLDNLLAGGRLSAEEVDAATLLDIKPMMSFDERGVLKAFDKAKGMLRLTSSAPLFIAMDKGYFKEEGIEIDPQWFDAAQPIAVATASSKVDVGATGITAGLYNMAAKGQKLYIVADKGREEKGYSSSALLAASSEYDNGLNSIEALKGKRVGITQKGSTFHYMLGRMLEAKGLSLDDVTVVPLGKLSAVMAALQSGQIDACILNEPDITKVKNEGYGKEITQVSAVMPYQTSGIFYSPEFAKNKDAAVRFMKAYNKACNEYYDAVVDKKDPAKLDEVVKIIAKYVKTPEADIRLGLPYVDKNGMLMADDIKTQIDWYSSHGMMDGKLDAKDVVNTSFLEEAMKK